MRLTKSKIFLFCLLFFVAGVGTFSFFIVDFLYLYSAFLIFLVLIAIFWNGRAIRIMILWLLFFILGAIRLVLAQPDLDSPEHIAFYNNQEVVIQGIVSQEPDVRLDHQKLTVSARSIFNNNKILQGRVLVKTGLYPEYDYGDKVRVLCQIQDPEPIEDFAYDKYLARYNIYSVCWRGDIEKISSGHGNPIMAGILYVKNMFMDSVNRILSEPHASFLAGLLVGARRGIPEYLMDAFNKTGTTHIIAISGSNVTIIAAVIIGFLRFIGISRKRAFWYISAGILIFVVMTGATASVVRAGIMGIFVLLARQLGRTSRATNALVFTAFLMLVANPKILMFDAGFQLSFLATVGLIYLNPIFQNYTKFLPQFFGIKEALVTTLSAMVTTTPLILYQFGRLSLVAPVANILILPVIPATMAFGFFAGSLGIVSIGLGKVLSWPAWLLLEYMIKIAEFLSSLPMASLNFGPFHWVLLLAMYSVIGFAIWKLNYKNNQVFSHDT